jgi:hypothetical protein
MNVDPIIAADTLAVDTIATDTTAVVGVVPNEEETTVSFASLMDSVRWKGGYFAYLNPAGRTNQTTGVQVEACPYTLSGDRHVSLLMVVLLVAYLLILSHNRHYLKERFHQLFARRKPSDYANVQTQKEFRGLFFFQWVSVFVWALLGFCLLEVYYPHVTSLLSPYKVGAAVLAISCFVFLIQKILYAFVNWIFFDKKERFEWSDERTLLLTLEGLLLFPAILLLLYSPIEPHFLWLGIAILLLFLRFYLMIRTFLIFFGKFYDGLHLILYFCTLEVMPLFFWGVALYELQENWKVII